MRRHRICGLRRPTSARSNRKADVFVYYFFEDYDGTQCDLTARIQAQLEDLGQLFGERVSLLMPNPRYAIQVESELREKFQSLWWEFHGKLPGLFVCTAPLPSLDVRSDQGHLFPLANLTTTEVSDLILRIRRICDEQILRKQRDAAQTKQSKFKRFIDAIELKPGIPGTGIKIDLKKLARR